MDKAPDAFRTISEVADDLDVPQHVLRFWETRFTQIKPMKRSGGRRYYRPDDVNLLRGIRRLRQRAAAALGDRRRDRSDRRRHRLLRSAVNAITCARRNVTRAIRASHRLSSRLARRRYRRAGFNTAPKRAVIVGCGGATDDRSISVQRLGRPPRRYTRRDIYPRRPLLHLTFQDNR